MGIYEDLAAKFPKLMGKVGTESSNINANLKKFENAKNVRIDNYYNYWRSRILAAINNGDILSNGWAFSTLSGLASFETYIHTDQEVRSLYFNRSGEIGNTIDAIADKLNNHSLGGVILYGYGNLYRECYFIEYLKTSNLLKGQRIYLIDCSLYYHIFAKSPINPLRSLVESRQIKPVLLDYLDDSTSQNNLRYVRDDLNPTRPVLHIFLGNTFCNSSADSIKSTLDAGVRVGDFVIGEYALYTKEYFEDNSDDYVSEMAKIATAELFATSPSIVTTTNISHGDSSKMTEVKFRTSENETEYVFKSMLRRKFSNTELTSGKYELIASKSVLPKKILLDSFKRLSD